MKGIRADTCMYRVSCRVRRECTARGIYHTYTSVLSTWEIMIYVVMCPFKGVYASLLVSIARKIVRARELEPRLRFDGNY